LLAGLLLACAAPAFAQSGNAEAGKVKSAVCGSCHGADGNATLPGVPSLAQQPALHTFLQLVQFRAKRRADPQMSAFVEKLTDRDLQDLAAYYAAQQARAADFKVDEARSAAGARLAQAHFCGSCHMPDMTGQNQIPRLAGQNYDYLVKQLRGLKSGARRDIDGTMASAAQALSEQDIENISHYLAGMK
jgi:cytochrome c553